VSERFDPYALLGALQAVRALYVVVGGFARVVQGSGEVTRGLDVAPSMHESNLRRLSRAAEALDGRREDGSLPRVEELSVEGEPLRLDTRAGWLMLVPAPWGTRGYDDLRFRGNHENLGEGLRPKIASVVDLARMLEASHRADDRERLYRVRRLMEVERRLGRSRSLDLGR
jgi:hypothetical protein